MTNYINLRRNVTKQDQTHIAALKKAWRQALSRREAMSTLPNEKTRTYPQAKPFYK